MNQQSSPFNQPKQAFAANKYGIARTNLLLVILATVINIILAIADTGMYLLFSAFIPYAIAGGASLAARHPEQLDIEPFSNPTMLLVMGAVAAVLLLVPYLLCWIFSKKQYGWMIAALVMFSIDTLWLLLNFDVSLLLDILFHAYVLYYLIMGVRNGILAKRAPVAGATAPTTPENALYVNPEGVAESPEAAPAEANVNTAEPIPTAEEDTAPTAIPDSPTLRSAAASELLGEKIRVYVETKWNGHTIQYRRVGKDNEELIVDGQVYAEMPRTHGKAAYMTATVAGLHLEAGVSNSTNVITVNGKVIASTVRSI